MKYLTILLLLFISSCSHIFVIKGEKKGCWAEGRNTICGTALEYNNKTGLYLMETDIDSWHMLVKAEQITWK